MGLWLQSHMERVLLPRLHERWPFAHALGGIRPKAFGMCLASILSLIPAACGHLGQPHWKGISVVDLCTHKPLNVGTMWIPLVALPEMTNAGSIMMCGTIIHSAGHSLTNEEILETIKGTNVQYK